MMLTPSRRAVARALRFQPRAACSQLLQQQRATYASAPDDKDEKPGIIQTYLKSYVH